MTDERAAYVDQMFGRTKGYAAVAVKRSETSWDERTFAWPTERAKLLAWADTNASTGNIFICPSLRAHDGRAKNDMADGTCEWLWADVDWDKIPLQSRDSIKRKIARIGTYTVGSGSGDNMHVYVKLATPVPSEQHIVLNTGLRDYLWADNKHADNSLLRLPGTTNWKTRNGTKVRVVGGNRKARTRDALMALAEFAKVTTRDIGEVGDDWQHVDVPSLPGRMRRMCAMGVDEAIGRYGSRHGAVWGVASELIKAGLSGDQVHTAMDSFPAGVDKQDTERGYSLHRDVSRRLAHHATELANAADAFDRGDVDDEAFRDLSPDELAAHGEGANDPEVKKLLARWDVESRAKNVLATKRFRPPPTTASFSAAQARENPPEPTSFLIDGLCGKRHNVTVTAEYKTGKTSFCVSTIAKALVDGTPFLGEKAVTTQRVVLHWNCEMDADEFVRDYLTPAGIVNEANYHMDHLRGESVNILTAVGKQWAVDRLLGCGADVWVIDSLARVLRMAGVAEKENDEVLNVLMAIDEIKAEAGVDVCFIIAHTGRGEMAEGKERARGATVIDDWADARWVMTKNESHIRFLMVDGRGVKLATTALNYSEVTGASTLGIGGKADVRAAGDMQTVVGIVRDNPGINATMLGSHIKRLVKGIRTGGERELIRETIECGWIEARPERNAKGRVEKMHYVVLQEPKRGGATPRAVNMTKV